MCKHKKCAERKEKGKGVVTTSLKNEFIGVLKNEGMKASDVALWNGLERSNLSAMIGRELPSRRLVEALDSIGYDVEFSFVRKYPESAEQVAKRMERDLYDKIRLTEMIDSSGERARHEMYRIALIKLNNRIGLNALEKEWIKDGLKKLYGIEESK